jgi:hypothetical protein
MLVQADISERDARCREHDIDYDGSVFSIGEASAASATSHLADVV